MSESTRQIRDITPNDIPAITRIYNHYIQHSTSTFEEDPVAEHDMKERVRKVSEGSAVFPWLVATENGDVTGYAYACPWKERSAYRFSCETSVYINPELQSHGTGSALYSALLERLTEQGIRTAIGIVTLPNPASIRLHERFGFVKAGHLKAAGFKFGEWLDTSYWQKELHK